MLFNVWLINMNIKQGRGIQSWSDGSTYEGYWINDKANIRGKITHSHGEVYEGIKTITNNYFRRVAK